MVLRGLRKIFGIVLLIVNALLSLTSFLAVYSTVYFLKDSSNFYPDINVINGLNETTPFLYMGEVRINNTGLFAFRNFTVEFKLNERNGSIISHNEYLGDILAQESRPFPLNFSGNMDYDGSINMSMDFFAIDYASITGFLSIQGNYAFSLFNFDLNVTVNSDWFPVP